MKRSMLLLFALTGWMTSMHAEEMQTGEFPMDKMMQQNREVVKFASEGITKSLPQKVDKYTTLIRVEGQDTTLTYVFEINTGAKSDESVRSEDRTRMQKAVTSGICRSSKRFLDVEIKISYLYKSATSKEKLFQFNVSKDDCPQNVK